MTPRTALVILVAAGLVLRLALAIAHGPYGGDPLFSYQYRATLIAAGQWDGVFLMWHPPGYPLLLAAVMTLSAGTLSSYAAGVLISLVSTAALVALVDRLVRDRLARPEFRLVAAAIVLFNEGLIHGQSAVLTEPPYLVAIAAVLVLLDRREPGPRRVVLAGAVAGAATLLRYDGAAIFAGLFLLVWWRFGLVRALAFGAGFLAVAGWLLGNVSFVSRMQSAASTVLTVPEPLPWRVPAGLYHAMTTWLPGVVLLPFWAAASIGMWHLAFGPARDPKSGHALNLLLGTVLASGVLFCAVSIMHKRSGAFVVPLVAIWCAVAADAVAARMRRPALVLAGALAVVGVDAARLAFAWPPPGPPGATAAQARILQQAGAGSAPVFAFGSETEIYSLLGWPIVTRFFDWPSEVAPLYTQHRGDPAAFVRALADRGYRWLAVAAPEGAGDLAPQPYGGFVAQPLASDLAALAASPADLGVAEVGRAPAGAPYREVRVYRIEPR